jgi:hypothetical protein
VKELYDDCFSECPGKIVGVNINDNSSFKSSNSD